LNHFLGDCATALNLAVEESMLRERDLQLLDHDKFIRDNFRAKDIVIISVGVNDIALRPTFTTMRYMLQVAWLTSRLSPEGGRAWPLSHFTRMLKDQV
jgi:hypothetical protein